jgi:copper(I)-binding protein
MLRKLAGLRLATDNARLPAPIAAVVMALSLSLLAGCPATPDDANGIRAQNPWVREPLPGQSKTAAYLELRNNTSGPVTLIKAHSTHARAIEIHESTNKDGMVGMRRVDKVVIPGQETVRFAPGGLHLMLFGIDELPATVEVQLVLASEQTITVPFRRAAAGTQ